MTTKILNEVSRQKLAAYLVKRSFWHASPQGIWNTVKAASELSANVVKQGSVKRGISKTMQHSKAAKKALNINLGMAKAERIVHKEDTEMQNNDNKNLQEGEMSRIHELVSDHLPKGHIIHGLVMDRSTPNYIVVKTAHKKELKNVQYHHLMRDKDSGSWTHKFVTHHMHTEEMLPETHQAHKVKHAEAKYGGAGAAVGGLLGATSRFGGKKGAVVGALAGAALGHHQNSKSGRMIRYRAKLADRVIAGKATVHEGAGPKMAGEILGKAFPKASVRPETKYALAATAGVAGGAYGENAARKYLNRKKEASYREKHKEHVKEAYGFDDNQYDSLPIDILSELSVNTLSSYAKKALPDTAHHFAVSGKTHARKFFNRYTGVGRAKMKVRAKDAEAGKKMPNPDSFKSHLNNYSEGVVSAAGKTIISHLGKAKKAVSGHLARNSKKYAFGTATGVAYGSFKNRNENFDSKMRGKISNTLKHTDKEEKHLLGTPVRKIKNVAKTAAKAGLVGAAGVGGYMLGGAASSYLSMGDDAKEGTSLQESVAGEVYDRIAQYKKMGFRVMDVHVTDNKADFTVVDKEGTAKRHIYEHGKRRVENMGSMKPADDDDAPIAKPKKSKFKVKVKK